MRVRVASSLSLCLALSGCLAGPTPGQVAAVTSDRDQNEELARQHKITWTEAANRDNATLERVSGSHLGGQERLLMAYRSALFSQVDAGQITPETAKYQLEDKKLAIISYNDEQQRQAFANLANVGVSIMQSQQPPPPAPMVMCTSTQMGTTVNTMCH